MARRVVVRAEGGQLVDYEIPAHRIAVHRDRERMARNAAVIATILAFIGMSLADVDGRILALAHGSETWASLITLAGLPVSILWWFFTFSWFPSWIAYNSENLDIAHFKRHGRWPDDDLID